MAGIMDAFGLAGQQDQQLTQQAVGLNTQAKDMGTQLVEMVAQKAEQDRIAVQQKLEGELAAQTAARTIATSLGANPDSQNFALAKLGQAFWDTFDQATAVQDQIIQKSQVGFFDNPVKYLMNQATVGQDVELYNALALKSNTALGAMQEINATVQSSAAAQRSIAESVTRDSIKAALDSQAISAKIQGMELQQKNLSFDMDSIKLMMNNNDRTLQRAMQMNSVQVQQQQLAISAGHLRLAQAEAADRARDRATKLAEKQESEQGWVEATRIYNIGAGIQGFAPQSPDQLKSSIAFQGDVGKKKFEQFYTSGLVAAGTGNKVIGGSTVGDSTLTIMKNNSPLNSGMQDTKDFLGQLWQKSLSTVTATGAKPTEQNVSAAVNSLVDKQLKVMNADVSKDPYGKNIYKAPDLKTMMTLPSVASSKFGQTVVYTQIAGGGLQTNPEVLIDAGIQAVRAGTLSVQEFTAGFTNFFNEAKQFNNATKNFKAVNLPLQSTYNTSVYTGTALPFGRHEIVDLSNPTQVTNFLMRRVTRQKAEAEAGPYPSMFMDGSQP